MLLASVISSFTSNTVNVNCKFVIKEVELNPEHDPSFARMETLAKIPIFTFNGANDTDEKLQRKVAITAGIHGGEFLAVEAARCLIQRLSAMDAEKICGTIVICPIANPPAFYTVKNAFFYIASNCI